MDGATQRHTHVQQMSDQASPLPFAFISVSGPTAVPSDQAAAWLNPDLLMSQDEIEFAGVAPQLSRFELSGQLGELSTEQSRAVAEAVTLYKTIRADVGNSDPVWPWGLPGVDDHWLTLAQRNAVRTLIGVWRRDGSETEREIELPWFAGTGAKARVLFPSGSDASVGWISESGALSVTLPRAPMAVLIEVS